MSFNIFAAGSIAFHYSKSNRIDGDTFETMKLLSSFSSARTVVDVVATAEKELLPSTGISSVQGYGSVARMTVVRNIEIGLALLRTQRRDQQGAISIHTTQSSLLWTNISRFAQYNFFGATNPGAEFMRTIIPALEATDMNNWAVLTELSRVIGFYNGHLFGEDPVRLQIQLSK
jgi:hypothetical protein